MKRVFLFFFLALTKKDPLERQDIHIGKSHVTFVMTAKLFYRVAKNPESWKGKRRKGFITRLVASVKRMTTQSF